MSTAVEEDAAHGFVTGEALARVLDLDVRHVQRLASEGVLAKDGRGNYHLIRSINGYCRYFHERQGRDSGFTKQRARFIGARADLAEMELRRRSATLVNAADVQWNWRKLVALIKRRCMQIPGAVAPRLMKCTKPTEVYAVIDAEIRQALTELSETEVRMVKPRRKAQTP